MLRKTTNNIKNLPAYLRHVNRPARRAKIRLLVGAAVFVFSFAAVAVTFAAWAPPTAAPPADNAAEPINVSDTNQTKAGDLTIHKDRYARLQLVSDNYWSGIEIRRDSAGEAGRPHIDFSNDLSSNYGIRVSAPHNNALTIEGGSLGIGLTGPAEALDVNGDQYLRGGDLYANENLNVRLDRDGGQNRYFAVRDNGGTWRFLAYENGYVYARNRFYTPIMYDYNNTSYYANPSSWSVFAALRIQGGEVSSPNSGPLRVRSGSEDLSLGGNEIDADRDLHINHNSMHGLRVQRRPVTLDVIMRQHSSSGNDGSICPSGWDVRGVPGSGEAGMTNSNHMHICLKRSW